MREPTHAQREVVRLIAAHQREHGTSPTDARNVDAVCERIRDAVRRAKT